MSEMMVAACTVCGKQLGKYMPGSGHETVCPHCKAHLQIRAEGDILQIRRLVKRRGETQGSLLTSLDS